MYYLRGLSVIPGPRYQLTYLEFVIYHDVSEKNVVKFTNHDIPKKYIRKKFQLTYCNLLGRHIRDILKKYITIKYRDIPVIDINDILK